MAKYSIWSSYGKKSRKNALQQHFYMKVSLDPTAETISQNDKIFWILIKNFEVHNKLQNYEKILKISQVIAKKVGKRSSTII